MSTRGRKGEKQLEILNFIHKQVKKKGYPPTVREIGEATALSSTSTVHGHLARLEKNGYIIRDPSKPRAIEFTAEGLDKLGINLDEDKIPLLGIVTAGEPILAIEEATDYFPIPTDLEIEKGNLFMLTIRGDSMMDAGILDGDQVIIRKQASANNGDIVIAMTDEDEATCKRFFKEDNHIRLQPENETMDPILLNHVKILGKVISLYRSHIF
ncbi:transcriptional repressor LexA [Alkalibacterium sp. 20]|uniref:transcriptional repressor LexA n=1 Tax=Alkalibacterium sp. 20 TaxID=1798803 RepID=UPI0009001C86|nr:transcriptional repressor LexA [Alkalibacterium sp. 20]OJF95199.1 LexA family transcriptional regulator [Alkalibacterium sp. 20]